MISEKILFVDDERNVLEGYQRQLRKQFRVEIALGPEAGLEAVRTSGPYAVVVSDLRMPGMDGISFLKLVRQEAPDTVRMMLTGFAEVQTAIEAVNEGNVFRFLTKPCDPALLAKTLHMGLTQYRLVMAERELLEETLQGSIRVLTQILSLLNPEAFGRASRIQRYVREIAFALKLPESWQLETATMLSQIGLIMLPEATLKKIYHGQLLDPEETQLFDMHPCIARDLLKHIPRLEEVADIITYQAKGFDGSGVPHDGRAGEQLPIGSRILKVVLDFDTLEAAGRPRSVALQELKNRSGRYDPEILTALETILWIEDRFEVQEITLREVKDGMIFDADVYTKTQVLLVPKGQEVSPLIRRRLVGFAAAMGLKEPLRVLVPRRPRDTQPAAVPPTTPPPGRPLKPPCA
jgi:response regulator RpfG family c-di-GMP phosphodiesterase